MSMLYLSWLWKHNISFLSTCTISTSLYIIYQLKRLPHFPASRNKQNFSSPPTTSRFLFMSIPYNGPIFRFLIPWIDLREWRDWWINWLPSHPLKAVFWSGEGRRELILFECFRGKGETLPVVMFSFTMFSRSIS